MIQVHDLMGLPVFRRASRAQLDDALGAFIPCEIGPGEVLMREGEADRAMVILLHGEASVFIGETRIELTRVGPGEILGDMALFGSIGRRSATVITSKPCQILLLDAEGLKHLRRRRNPVVGELEHFALSTASRRLRETWRLISSVAVGEPRLPGTDGLLRFFRKRPEGRRPQPYQSLVQAEGLRDRASQTLDELAELVEPVMLRQGEILFREGDPPGSGYIVVSGGVDLYGTTLRETYERVMRLRQGQGLGMLSLVDGLPRLGTAVAHEPSWLLELPLHVFSDADGSDDSAMRSMLRITAFSSLATGLRLANSHVEFLQGKLNGHALDPRFKPL